MKARRGSFKRLKRQESAVVFQGRIPARFGDTVKQRSFRILSSLILVFILSWTPYNILSIMKVVLEPEKASKVRDIPPPNHKLLFDV